MSDDFLPGLDVPKNAARLKSFRADYESRLAHTSWKVKQGHAKELANGLCWNCSNPTTAFEVHHRTYARLWHEREGDLVAVCADCHRNLDRDRVEKMERFLEECREANSIDSLCCKKYGDDPQHWPIDAEERAEEWIDDKRSQGEWE